jgi:hypothetical protein
MRFRWTIANFIVAIVVTVVFTFLLVTPGTARSANQPQPVLVELFTSEGCSSCPPADRLLMELDRQQPVPGADIIVLSEHVDYWNQQGWFDPYSLHQWTQRQEAYGRRFNLDSTYTPQMVIDGEHQAGGNEPRAVLDAIRQSAIRPRLPIEISSVTRAGNKLQVAFTANSAPGVTLFAALADESDRSTIIGGENAGHTLEHVAVLRSLIPIATLQSTATEKTVEIEVPHAATKRQLRLVLFAQDIKSGQVLGVSGRKL